MVASDRKARRGSRQEKGLRPTSAAKESIPTGVDDAADAQNFAAAVVKSAQLEAHERDGARILPASELAHVPSPHRRRDWASSPVELASSAEASPTAGSYRDRLRANGQHALQRQWNSGAMLRPGPPPPPPSLDSLVNGGASPSGCSANMEAMAGPEQYMAMCCAGIQQSPSSWTSRCPQGSSGFWTEAGLDVPQMPMPLQDGLMAIAMPQCYDMNGAQIAAQLLAAAPVCYED